MRLRTRISISLWAIFGCSASAQTADDFFHSGAQSYLTNNVPFAIQRVDEGLKRFPNDEKLKKLDELLKKQQQQQSKSDQSKDQKQDQKQNSDQQKQQNDQKQKQDQNQQSKQDQEKKDKKDQAKPDEQQQPKPDDPKKDQQPDDQQQQQKFAPGQMTPQQARQLLDSQKDSEMMLPIKPDENVQRRGTLRDW